MRTSGRKSLRLAAVLCSGLRRQSGLKAGDHAPDFNLKASDGRDSRHASRQAVVLGWFEGLHRRF